MAVKEPWPRAVPAAMRTAILAWYDARGRSLPFRGPKDPYLVLVSEVMAQQTQIARVGEAWREFTAVFPSFERLAAASPADVLRAWRGLGYNRRALNLWRAAKVVVEEHGGRLPADVAELERLPGIGPYTARAVAAIAFGSRSGPSTRTFGVSSGEACRAPSTDCRPPTSSAWPTHPSQPAAQPTGRMR